MNNNRNNRRRGRGNRNQSGNGNQVNRIDSRARGNAPQLLDKYKKLAQDAQHHGDRVQMEYYLQFADHYFRVIADNKARQDEARGRRLEEREQQQDDNGDDGDFERPRRSDRGPRQRSDDNGYGRASEEGETDHEGELSSDYNNSEDDTNTENAGDADNQEAAERAAARRTRQRKPRESNGAEKPARKRSERSDRTDAEDKPRRKPRRKSHDDEPAGIDSSILPPSLRAEESGDSDDSLEKVN